MGLVASRGSAAERSDLSEEQIEEIRMLTACACVCTQCASLSSCSRRLILTLRSLLLDTARDQVPVREIERVRRKYRSLVQREEMTKDEFYALPGRATREIDRSRGDCLSSE